MGGIQTKKKDDGVHKWQLIHQVADRFLSLFSAQKWGGLGGWCLGSRRPILAFGPSFRGCSVEFSFFRRNNGAMVEFEYDMTKWKDAKIWSGGPIEDWEAPEHKKISLSNMYTAVEGDHIF